MLQPATVPSKLTLFFVILLLQEVHTFAVEVSQPPMPQVDISRSLDYQLWPAAPVSEIQREGGALERKDEVVCFRPCVVQVGDRHNAVVRSFFHFEKIAPQAGYKQKRYLDEELRSVAINDITGSSPPIIPPSLVPPGGDDFARCVQNLILGEFVAQLGEKGVVEVVPRHTTVDQPVDRTAILAVLRPCG